jgi:molybdenum cofactor guanylyltransferase
VKVGAAILAGGRATRMGGVLKGLCEVGGRAIVAREAAVLARVVDDVMLVAAELDPWRAVLAPSAGVNASGGGANASGVRFVQDRQPGRGPLAGLDAALAASDADALIVVGCDLPFLDERLLARVRDAAPGADAVVPRVAGRAQPLHARYARRATAVAVSARLAAGALALTALLDDLAVTWLDEPELRALDATLRGLTNVNTIEELAAAQASEEDRQDAKDAKGAKEP